MTFLEIILSSVGSSALVATILVWLFKEMLRKSIQHEYNVKLEEIKADCQKFLDENRISFSWWHEEQAKAIKETYIAIAELCIAVRSRINCVEKDIQNCGCHKTIIEKHKYAQKIWECNKIFIDDKLHPQIDQILSITLEIKTNASQAKLNCGQKKQEALEYCHENREKIDSILSELRKELRKIMSGGKTDE